MKTVIISDSHGNIANLKHVLGFAERTKAGVVIHCGDWDNLEAVETVLSFGIPLYSVLGNADIDPLIREKLKVKSQKFAEKFLKFEIVGRKIGIVHDIKYLTSSIKYLSILFSGHKHQQREFIQDGIKTVNPGALENAINFAVYDTETSGVEFLDL